MIGYIIPTRSPCCDLPLEHVTSSKVDAGTSCCAVARCGCGSEFSIHVQLREVPKQRRRAA